MKPTVVILLSDKRSGSTQFERELCKHPDVQHVGYSPHSYSETQHWLKAAVVLEQPPERFSGGRPYRGHGGRRGARAMLIAQVLGEVPGFEVPADDRALVFEGWEAICHRRAAPVFFEKSPQHLAHPAALDLMLEWAERTAFDVRFIGLVRNPSAVLCSAWELFGTAPEDRMEGWVEIHRNLLAVRERVGRDRLLEVSYESMVTDPRGVFRRVQAFIGVDEDSTLGADVHGQSIDRWRSNERFGYRPSESLLEMAERFGYPAEEVRPPEGRPVASRPRRRVARIRKLMRNRILVPAWTRLKQGGQR